MPAIQSTLQFATGVIVFFLLVSAAAFFLAGPGFSWFYPAPAASTPPTASPSPSPSPEPIVAPSQPSPLPEVKEQANSTEVNETGNFTNQTLSPSPSPLQEIEISVNTSTPLPPTQFGMPFSRSSFPIYLRSEFPTAVAARFADLDSNGNMDVVLFQGALGVHAYLPNGQRIWGWDNPPFENLAGERQAPGAVYDFDRDGRPEVAFFKAEASELFLVLFEGSNGKEKVRRKIPLTNTSTLALAVGDFSKSGWKGELAVLARNSSQQQIIFYDALLNQVGEYNSSRPLGNALAALDVNGDGRDEAIASGVALQLNGTRVWSLEGSYSTSEAEEITLVDLHGAAQIVFSYGKDGVLVVDREGKLVWSSSYSNIVHATGAISNSNNFLATVLEVRQPAFEQGLAVFSSAGGKVWGIERTPVQNASRPFECAFGGAGSLFYAGKFYEVAQGNSSLEEFGRGIACADLLGDGREELVALRSDAGGSYLDIYSNPVAAQPSVSKRNSDLQYLLQKGTLPATRSS